VRATVDRAVRARLAEHGLGGSHILVLDALLKLRQTCCDPRLVRLGGARGVSESVKLTALMERLPALIEEGRRVLVFSQFAGMIRLIAEAVTAAGLPFVTLTGETGDRRTPIERFQSGAVPIFLISLRAGGVGLNLTAADTVIHYDPWWNPAVERQATDRAHRIGQDKPVFVYKLVVAGSVEERILELQERKAALASAILEGSELAAGALTREDIDALLQPLAE
jgi:SNF2 family DNA or RNA helicase